MAYIFKLPDVGEGLTEADILQWFVKEGDVVKVDDPLVEIQNDKSSMEIPSPVAGTVVKILVPDGVAQVDEGIIEINTGDDVVVETVKVETVEAAPSESSGNYVFELPDVGEGLTEADILQWFVKEGDVVKVDDPLVEIQNDKSSMEIPSPVAGTVVKILVPEGVAQVDEAIIEINKGDSPVAAPKAEAKTEVVASAAPVATSTSKTTGIVRALPSVRRYARQQQVDLAQVVASGPNNKILKSDVDAYLAGGSSAPTPEVVTSTVSATPASASAPKVEKAAPAPVTVQGEDWVEKMTPTRRAIAKAMVTSRTEIPHVTVFDKLRTEKLVEHRNMYKEIAKEEDVKLTFLPYVVKAMVAMLKAYPSLNASVNMTKSEIVHRGNINIGIATNTEHGLFVPVIKNADRKSVFEIAEEISHLSKKAMANELTRADMSGSSATITNIGGMPDAGGVWSTPIINYPESMIMGISRISDEVVVNANREMEVASIMRLSFAFDHRLVDGVEAQNALAAFKKALGDPNLMLLKN
ncbi:MULTISPECIES: 2-oxo acid dehydrogenase subunit E2 [Vagococcus]|uniref:Dihydrolipoamide acetyltransferase component of pyruvate dehydrogenase complex n=1 Tax=Vagococcus fluvialis bH819 TaxID=1255619 RepID=A0A1X6WN57_9ENTE|nr:MULTISPECIES: 2-oxo acid dehydrogenase subunit E2 [Vagococcus]SLM85699.1 Dihydrolipoamide acetyltransferase component of pyruvate dehydrogenase complex [Vagococcus fluvialis bH819]HCM90121.1 dihydrolipoamide acetyltransferase [Vagococcus sp.]